MAVDACIKHTFVDNGDDDDDEEPAFFKRTKTVSKQNQLNAELKKTHTQKNDGPSRKQAPDGNPSTVSKQSQSNTEVRKLQTQKNDGPSRKHAPDGISPTVSKQSQSNADGRKLLTQNNDGPSRKQAADGKSPTVSKQSQSNAEVWKAHTQKKAESLSSSKESTPLANKSKQSSGVSPGSSNMEKKHSNKPLVKPDLDAEDSEDDKPLSFRLSAASAASPKSNSTNTTKGLNSSGPSSSAYGKTKVSVEKSSEDLDDKIPLSTKFNFKPPSGSASVKQSYESDEDETLASKFQQNGSSKRDNEGMKSPKISSKRPLTDTNISVQSSVKKPKPSDASDSNKMKHASVKAEPKLEDDDDDDVPIAQRMKKSTTSDSKLQPMKKSTALDCKPQPVKKSSASDTKSQSTKKTPTKVGTSSLKRTNKNSKKIVKKNKYSKSIKMEPSSGEGQKWTTLVHNGVIFPPPYKPHGVKMLYNGQPVDLTPEQEEVATMFAVMKDTDYAAKPQFLENFMNDWRVVLGKSHVIKKFELCDFTPIYEWHQDEKEKKKQMTTEEKKLAKEEKLKVEEKYMWAVVDGVKEKVGNFRVEPPGLFRGRGEHPKMGKLKRRIRPRDITINIGKKAPIPECPIPGERWKEVKHDNTVTWLAFWNDPINPKEFKYVFLAASSSLKGQSDKEKYEKARLLKDYIHNIRENYTKDFRNNKDITKKQIAVATYLIDKLALRAGNEKDDDEADTVGCCTLKVENVTLVPQNKLEFDFLGKDSIRYFNTVEVEPRVYEAIGQFKSGKKVGDDLFDKLDTSKLNAHLKELMPGLTAKVFRTYNASITLDEQLHAGTKGGNVLEKVGVYQSANKEVAIICNHQKTVSKTHTAQMTKLNEKMDELKAVLEGLKEDLARAKKGKPPLKDADGKPKKNLTPEALERKIAQTNAKIEKMELGMKSKEELKTVALGTSKINYLDPRISVAWCKRQEVPIEKIFTKSLLEKFAWAMDVDPDFRF